MDRGTIGGVGSSRSSGGSISLGVLIVPFPFPTTIAVCSVATIAVYSATPSTRVDGTCTAVGAVAPARAIPGSRPVQLRLRRTATAIAEARRRR